VALLDRFVWLKSMWHYLDVNYSVRRVRCTVVFMYSVYKWLFSVVCLLTAFTDIRRFWSCHTCGLYVVRKRYADRLLLQDFFVAQKKSKSKLSRVTHLRKSCSSSTAPDIYSREVSYFCKGTCVQRKILENDFSLKFHYSKIETTWAKMQFYAKCLFVGC